MCLLKESGEAVEEELKARSTALVHNAEEVAQQRAESNALRFETGSDVHISHVLFHCGAFLKKLTHWWLTGFSLSVRQVATGADGAVPV